VLARLNAISGVACSHVDPTGRHFLIELGSEADAEKVSVQVMTALGAGSQKLEAPWDEPQAAGWTHGELWLDSNNILMLSLLEARMLAARWSAKAGKELGLPGEAVQNLEEVIREELASEFERVHKQGGSSDRRWYVRPFASAFDRVADRMKEVISQNQAEAVRAVLDRLLPP